MSHELNYCALVPYSKWLKLKDAVDHEEGICHQGWADIFLDGINWKEAERIR